MNEGFEKGAGLFELGRTALDPTREELDRTYEAILSRAALVGAEGAIDGSPKQGARFATIFAKAGVLVVAAFVAAALMLRSRHTAGPALSSDRTALAKAAQIHATKDVAPFAGGKEVDARDLPFAKTAESGIGSATQPPRGRALDAPFSFSGLDGTKVPKALADEIALMKKMADAERSGHTKEALSLAETHERTFPSGVFREEREAIRALAICSHADTAGAEAAGQRFVAAFPRSSLVSRVRGVCTR